LTFRSIAVSLAALLLMGIWIEYVERFSTTGGPLAENSPPNSAVGIILLILAIGAGLYRFRRALRLHSRELVVVYAALVVASPLMSQGLWGRLVGLTMAIPNNQDFKSYTSLPPQLWPHGENLAAPATSPGGIIALQQDTNNPAVPAAFAFTIDRFDAAGRERLVPGESFLFTALVKTENLQKNSSYFVTVQADSGPVRPVLTLTAPTHPSLALPDGYERIGASPLIVPATLDKALHFTVGLNGPGRLLVRNIDFFNVESVEGLYAGRKIVRESELANLGPGERNFTLVKPDRMLSPRGLKYLLTGFIPMRDWVKPLCAWSFLVIALFAGFYGLNLFMRKQWAEHERFSFPLLIVPRHLFTETLGPDGTVVVPLFRNRIMWLGFAFTLPLLILKGLHFYNPAIPSPEIESTPLAPFVTSPIAKAYLQNISIGNLWFSTLSIALLVETNILFSLWSFFLLFQLWNLFGRAFNLNRIPGYPWNDQQTMGSYIGYALAALFVARRHLRDAFRAVIRGGSDAGQYRLALALVAASLAGLALWGAWVRMGWLPSLLFFGYMLVLGFSASKIRAECGAAFGYITPYVGMQFAGALGGFALFGPTGMLVATIASGFMTTACFLFIAPVQLEMMELGRQMDVRPRDIGAGLALGLLGGLVIGGFVLLCWAYGYGANNMPLPWFCQQNWYFNHFRTAEAAADRAFQAGTLLSIPETRMLDVAHNVDAKGLGIGAAITLLLAWMRTQFMWFPLHPIGYILSSTYFMAGQWFTILVAWAIRSLVFRIGGAQTIRKGLVPFCVGMFLASVFSVILFTILGLILRSQGITDVYTTLP
jgi:hypothetical protein